jgi:hypothetical protein
MSEKKDVQEIVTDKAKDLAGDVAENVVDELFDQCHQHLKIKIGKLEINFSNIMTVVKFSMEVVEVSEAKGKRQKSLVVQLVKQIVKDAPISDEKEKFLLDMIDNGVLGNTIDLIIDASKGKLNINKVGKCAKTVGVSCFSACFKK